MRELIEMLRDWADPFEAGRKQTDNLDAILLAAADALEQQSSELKLCRESHLRLEALYNQALSKLGLPPFQQILADNANPPEAT